MADLKQTGVNRISLGIQSFDDRMLDILGRIHTSRQGLEAFKALRRAGFDNVGIDLIHALPGQTADLWLADLEQTLRLAPEHISVYGLSVEEDTPFAARYADDSLLPDEDLAADMFEAADTLLAAGGYEHYEIANYARPGFRSRHNSGYWRRDGYLGIGAGAHSFLRDHGGGRRFSTVANLAEYQRTVEGGQLPHCDVRTISRVDAMAEFMYLGLRLAEGVDAARFEEEFRVSLEDTFGAQLQELSQIGLLAVTSKGAGLTLRGRLLSNRVFACFLPD